MNLNHSIQKIQGETYKWLVTTALPDPYRYYLEQEIVRENSSF